MRKRLDHSNSPENPPENPLVAELGHFCLWLALALAVLQSTLPVYGYVAGKPWLLAVARPAALLQWLFLSIGLLTLAWAFHHQLCGRSLQQSVATRLPGIGNLGWPRGVATAVGMDPVIVGTDGVAAARQGAD